MSTTILEYLNKPINWVYLTRKNFSEYILKFPNVGWDLCKATRLFIKNNIFFILENGNYN